VGLIVGPSGCGKTTIAREIFGASVLSGFAWPDDKSVLDGFPQNMGIKDITALLSSVGFSSPPLWLRPFRVLSTGQQMRVNAARLLAEQPALAVMDEFTSVVDRTVAQIGSAAIAKTVRKRGQKFVGVTCHYDVADWLQPDWVYQPHVNEFLWRFPGRRPDIELEIKRVHSSAWQLFRQYHYLDTKLNTAARCFVAFWNELPVAFIAAQKFPHPSARNIWREHRLVCAPDYQGVGIGAATSECVASCVSAHGWRYRSVTSNPSIASRRARSAVWSMTMDAVGSRRASPSGALTGKAWKSERVLTRMTMAFEYVGPPMPREQATRLWGAVNA
jgi:hypothetical protein